MELNLKALLPSNSSIPTEVIPLYERYLLASPAIGASIRSSGFISDLGITTSALAEEWPRILDPEDNIIQFFESAASLEKRAIELQSNNLLFGPNQYYLCTRSEKSQLIKTVEKLDEYSASASSKLGKKATKLIMRRYYEVDSVYRHIRNALAHGCYELIAHDRFFFLDLDNDAAKLTAIGVLTTNTLEKWYKEACNLAERKL